MSDALAGIGNIFKTAAPALTGVSAAGGLIGNILNSITRGKAIGQLEKAENLSPSALAERVRGATQPLNQGLVEAVQNRVQADMASRGLAQAPGVFAAEESQALAPYQQQNQQTALNLILRQLGIPAEILQSTGGGSDVTSQLMQLMLRNPTQQNPFNYWAAQNAQPNVPAATPGIVPPAPDIGGATPGLDPAVIAGILGIPNFTAGGSTQMGGG